MSLKQNIAANYASQIYVTLIGIIMVPMYIKYMGAEAYGLVGFFTMLQAWFALLDMGLTPTLAREAARFQGGATDAVKYRQLVRSLEGVFLFVALLGGLALFSASGYVARDWLQAAELPTTEVNTSIKLMALAISLRWMCGLYRGVISGTERFVWLAAYNSIIATVRFIAVFPILIFIGVTPTIFFSFQFGIAVVELAVLIIYAYKLMPVVPFGERVRWQWEPLKPVLKFSLTISFTSSTWVIVTQTDKLVLSKLLSLDEFAYFTLAVMVAGALISMISPITTGVMPRMVRFNAERKFDEFINLYKATTQFVAVLIGSASVAIAFTAEPLIFAWTGSSLTAIKTKPILQLYSLGNGFLAMAGFPYLLQYANGNLRLHLIGSALFAILLIPCLILATSEFGAIGAGWVWLILNAISLMVWVPFVHSRIIPGFGVAWLFEDVFVIYIVIGIAGYSLSHLLHFEGDRFQQAIQVIVYSALLISVSCLSSSSMRKKAKMLWKYKL